MDDTKNHNSKGTIKHSPNDTHMFSHSQVVEGHGQKSRKNKILSTLEDVDDNFDNIIFKLTHYWDGRLEFFIYVNWTVSCNSYSLS